MRLIKEPKNVDLFVKSEPWSQKEINEFRKIMKELKAKRKKIPLASKRKKKQNA